MIKTTSKLGLVLVLFSLILAGCSTATQEEQQPEPVNVVMPPVQTPAEPKPVVEVILSTFYFDFDESTLNDKTKFLLRRHAEKLSNNPAAIILEGHADERGTREYNLALGERRAQAVQGFLRSLGVNVDIEVISYGEERPAIYNANNEQEWALNRRVELKFK
jgi:peptidoglycan-associated lipoprotein